MLRFPYVGQDVARSSIRSSQLSTSLNSRNGGQRWALPHLQAHTALYFATIPREGDSLAIERMLSRAALNRAITVAIDTPSKAAISS
jgi:hypothetical protein